MHYEGIVIMDLYGQLFPAGLSTQIYTMERVFQPVQQQKHKILISEGPEWMGEKGVDLGHWTQILSYRPLHNSKSI